MPLFYFTIRARKKNKKETITVYGAINASCLDMAMRKILKMEQKVLRRAGWKLDRGKRFL